MSVEDLMRRYGYDGPVTSSSVPVDCTSADGGRRRRRAPPVDVAQPSSRNDDIAANGEPPPKQLRTDMPIPAADDMPALSENERVLEKRYVAGRDYVTCNFLQQ